MKHIYDFIINGNPILVVFTIIGLALVVRIIYEILKGE